MLRRRRYAAVFAFVLGLGVGMFTAYDPDPSSVTAASRRRLDKPTLPPSSTEATPAWSSDLLVASDTISFSRMTEDNGRIQFWVAIDENSFRSVDERANVNRWIATVRAAKAARGRCRALDVGSNAGFYSLLSRSMGCEVLAIGAEPRCIHRLKSAAAVNGFSQGLETRWAAVPNNKSGEVETHSNRCSGSWSASSPAGWANDNNPDGVAETGVTDKAKMASMLGLVAGWLPPGEHIDVMKIDTEGHEFEVLLSMLPYLKERRVQSIMLEVKLESHTTTKEDIARIMGALYGLGYMCGPMAGSRYSKESLLQTFRGDGPLSPPDWSCILQPWQGAIWISKRMPAQNDKVIASCRSLATKRPRRIYAAADAPGIDRQGHALTALPP